MLATQLKEPYNSFCYGIGVGPSVKHVLRCSLNVFVIVIVFLMVRSCLFISLIKCQSCPRPQNCLAKVKTHFFFKKEVWTINWSSLNFFTFWKVEELGHLEKARLSLVPCTATGDLLAICAAIANAPSIIFSWFSFCIFMGIGDNERILGSSLLYSQLVIIDDDDSGWWWKLHMLNVIRATFVSNTDDTRPHFSASSAIIFLLLKMMVMIMLVFVELNGKVKITLRIQQIYFLN